jgi:DNA repair photolyase
MNKTTTTKDPTEAVLSKSSLNEKYLCDYVINVSTGCRHGCKFCYVPGTPNISTRQEMLSEEVGVDDGQEEWGDYVLYRDDIPERLPGILDRKRTWRTTEKGQGIVGVSFHTDCFMDQRAAEITASVIRTLASHKKYVRILTRNPMLASSYMDAFKEAGEYVTIGSSIPTLNEEYMNALEPDAPPIESRLRGLERFADAGVQVYVSMSPTYPTIRSPTAMQELLSRIAALDPAIVFHEPINPRGKNFQMTLDAAWAAECDTLGKELARVRDEQPWLRYACTHFSWVQDFCRENNIPVQLWPDKKLLDISDHAEERWLRQWRERQSPERFAGRPEPNTPQPSPPPLFSWES